MTSPLTLVLLAAIAAASACAAFGGNVAARITGPEWIVEDINGGGVIDNSRATLGFGDDGRLAGRASCNTYSASYALTRRGLTIGPAAVTRKACAPALMDQERKFLDALSAVSTFSIDNTGALILKGPDGKRVLARR